MRKLLSLWRCAKNDERGNASVEFVLVVPVFLVLFVSSFELGMATLRLTMLEHGLDKAMREVRLGTGQEFSREDIRDEMCEHAGLLKFCNDNLLLEMAVINSATFNLPEKRATCINTNDRDAIPVTSFTNGDSSDLMFIRACYVIDPLFPTIGLGAMATKDEAGNMQLIASSIFAQEPPKTE